MPAVRSLLSLAPVVLLAAIFTIPALAAPEPPSSSPAPAKASEENDIEVKYIDDSAMKLKVLDEKLELTTKHGILKIATADIQKIEFATRVPTDVAEKVAAAITRLNHPEFKVREAASEELKGYKARAYPQLLKAMKSEDPEINRRAEEIAKFIRTKVPAALLEVREFDIVHTADSKIAGKLTAEYLKVGTFQFGEQKVKLHDLYTLRTGAALQGEAVLNAVPGPAHLANYQNQFGKEYAFIVVGAQANGQGSVWGTDLYTLDSHLPSAVVHAGLAKPGETVTVRVRIVQTPPAFAGSTRNGITSAAYGPYPTGAYEFIRK